MLFLAALAAACGSPASAKAQGRLQLQAGGASALPEAAAVSDAAFYGVGGLTADWVGERSLAFVSLLGGLSTDDASGADFASGTAGVELWSGTGTAVGVVGRASGFQVRAPFLYRTTGVRGGPAARLRRGHLTATVRSDLGTGASRVELRRGERTRRAERDLWARGVELEISFGGRRWTAEASAGSWDSDGGPFRRGGVSLTLGGGDWALRVDGVAWDTPAGEDWSGGAALLVPLGGRGSATATVGRAPPDPLTLVDAGGQAGVVLGWTLASFGGPPAPVVRLAEGSTGVTAHFRLDGPRTRHAGAVAVLGDFNAWVAAPMRRADGVWLADIPVPPGVHHYGFLVDGEWWVPEGRSGNVPDEWGRTNATLVVAGSADGGQS